MERADEDACRVALLDADGGGGGEGGKKQQQQLAARVWEESRKLWDIVAPAIFSRVVTYSMNVITQAFAGHLGDLELAAISIANTVVVGFNFGLMLGMASALETLCGQAFGAKKFHMMGVYMQRSWIVLFMCAVLLLPMYFFAEDVLLLTGQPPELAAMAGKVCVWFIPLHFSFAFLFPLQRFLQCQMRNSANAAAAAAALCVHLLASWLLVSRLRFGLAGIALTLNFSWWATGAMLFAYVACGGCPDTWHGFSLEAFAGMWEFVKLSSASGVMLCLENWYYRILVLLTGNLKDAAIAVDALSICMSINGWQMMIPLAFFAGTGVRVANELGAGNGEGARFATIVSTVTSLVIGLFFWVLIMGLHDKYALIFTSSPVVLDAVDHLSVLLAFTILLNSIQPILSGVAVGSGWQSMVAYVNIGCYYLIGIPMGILLGWLFNLGVLGIWAGMIGGTAVQTLVLAIMTVRCDWEKEALIASTRMGKLSEVR
ncbi:putative MATE efflux family protein [Zea mays]|uniref:Protein DETOXIFICATION n=3 Tax=Zea mays TaxID=4577 RepID=A0A1D6JR45_MAIZE|nr:putative MATE efflux family protein [Zea mays]ONL94427.1 Protein DETOXIFICATION 27 [Zea mays]|eukprot:NP_001337655.1 putative MATE efflux family protein [Zea mays]